jgi:prevent-host-death family protein
MAEYSVAEAKNNLPKLLARVQAGEEVTITKRGKPIARIVPQVVVAPAMDAPKSANDVEWILEHQVKTKDPKFDSAKFLRQVRDEYRY